MTKSYIVTSALPYINGVKHLGNLIGSILPADVYTRYLKLLGHDAIYICGTDEHGTPAELSALKANMDVKEYCDQMYETQKKIYEDFNINFDYFGRTSDVENHEITQEIFLALKKNGYINEKVSTQLYSVDENRYLPDRYVNGTCPHCNYEGARGDQCENCTTLLDPTDLINPFSATNPKSTIETREVNHFYIDLPKLQDKVGEWVEQNTQWPTTTLSTARKWLKEGLQERGITRNLKWGIDIPLEGYDDLVFYVWFDAPIGYISITKKWADEIVKKPELFDKYWKDNDVKLIQFLGLDNVPFHTVTFPCTIIGADLGYNLAHYVKGFQWLTYEKGKFSTSQNRGIFTDTALELYPADYFRYYLLLIAPERQETDFQWEGFQNAVNNDLNNVLGNLLNRLVLFSNKNFEGKIFKGRNAKLEKELKAALDECITEYRSTLDDVEFQKPLKALRKFWQEANKYFQAKKPWAAIKENPEDAKAALSVIAHAIRSSAILAAPFIPKVAEDIYERLGLPREQVHEEKWDDIVDWNILEGSTLPDIKGNLFEKISKKEIDKLKERFGSKEEKKEEPKKKKKKKSKKPKFIEYDDFAKVKLISAKVLKVEPHPDADKLLVMTIDDGKRQDRTLCAGIAEHYSEEDLVGQTIIIVDNLEPKELRGVMSEGMLLAVDDADGIHILQPNKEVEAGLRVR